MNSGSIESSAEPAGGIVLILVGVMRGLYNTEEFDACVPPPYPKSFEEQSQKSIPRIKWGIDVESRFPLPLT
jgi:hypothetical protein